MKILFENTTTYNKNLYLRFNEFHNNKYGLKYELYTLLFAIIMLYCIILNFKNKVYHFGFLFILILITYIFWRFFRPVFTFKKEINSQKITEHQKFTYQFYKYYFKILHKKEQSYLSYFKIRIIFETDKEYYLYLDKTHALLLDKDCFTVGTSDEFSNFIKKKCWYKYKKEKNLKDS